MKKYIKPKIVVIDLDQKQAILSACKIGGIYLHGTLSPNCGQMPGAGFRCSVTPKGGPGNSYLMYFTQTSTSIAQS